MSGCQVSPPAKQAQAPKAVLSTGEKKIENLLVEAERAFEASRLTTPVSDNAYLRYLQILSIDSSNTAAEQGIANIVEKYLAWSIDAVNSGQYRKATDYLNKARSVDENHTNIDSVANLLSSHLDGGKKTYSFTRTEVQERNSGIITRLEVIAADITKFNARVVIEAPSDPTARWIYQQLNNATSERVSAQFERTSRVRVHLFY
jgi:hypothetical protein